MPYDALLNPTTCRKYQYSDTWLILDISFQRHWLEYFNDTDRCSSRLLDEVLEWTFARVDMYLYEIRTHKM